MYCQQLSDCSLAPSCGTGPHTVTQGVHHCVPIIINCSVCHLFCCVSFGRWKYSFQKWFIQYVQQITLKKVIDFIKAYQCKKELRYYVWTVFQDILYTQDKLGSKVIITKYNVASMARLFSHNRVKPFWLCLIVWREYKLVPVLIGIVILGHQIPM